MKRINVQSLDNLSKAAYSSGLPHVFLGIAVVFAGVIDDFNLEVMSIGLFIFMIGYAFVKIGKKLKTIIQSENYDRLINMNALDKIE